MKGQHLVVAAQEALALAGAALADWVVDGLNRAYA
jgi:hypothetical protein